MTQCSYHSFWGKAEKEGQNYHLLPYHSLDVAAVFECLLSSDTLWCARVAKLSPMPVQQTVSLLTFLVALHDLGKFSLPFQNKRPDIAHSLGIAAYPCECTVHHTTHGWWLFNKFLFRALTETPGNSLETRHKWSLSPLIAAVMGHHGTPVEGAHASRNHFSGTIDAAVDFARDAAQLFLVESLDIPEEETTFLRLSWLFAGLCVLADWIGSNSTWFPLRSAPLPMQAYLVTIARPAAEKALSQCGLRTPASTPVGDFHALLPHLPDTARPSQLQHYALNDAVTTTGPQLHILEDLTGGGKTEAALLAAHALLRQGEGQGFYIGLPTMATANAMYARLAETYRALFAAESDTPSLMLAHGARHINDEFLASIPLERTRADAGHDREPFCSTWLADNRKKALLAPAGAGTLDQALLSVLPVRHQCLRLTGLARNVLIADEVHAYDPYTTELLCALLAFHAALGGSAILLSATMPQELRSTLLSAFASGACDDSPEPDCTAFPLATCLDRNGIRETPVAATRSISAAVELTENEGTVYDRLLQVRRHGGCAIWIRNTVDQTRAAYEHLIYDLGVPPEDVLLFHARFTLHDRQRIEAEALRIFGKESTPADRRGKILVASQVAEQSLDIDGDFLATDLAPMELMLQRLGREHRHPRDWRPQGYEQPLVLVLSPDPVSDPETDWYERVLGKAKHVYPRPALLWRTARLLKESGRIDLLPDSQGNIAEARRLIEAAYGDMDAPEILVDAEFETMGKDMAEKALALSNILPLEQGYCHSSTWYEDTVTPTRLGEETVQLRLVKTEGSALALWAGTDTSALTCALSEVRVRAKSIADPDTSRELAARLEDFRTLMPDEGKWCRLMPMRQENSRWVCDMQNGKGRLLYDAQTGLRIEKG